MLIPILLAQIAFGLLAMTICLPSMQEWGAIFGASQASVQLTFSAYALSYGLLQLVYGPLSDRYGRKKLLLTGLTVAMLGSILAALAPTLALLTAARMVQGAGSAAGMVIGRSLVQDLFEGPQRTRVLAYFGMVLGLCPPLATIIGGQLHVRLGWQANFVLMALLAALLLFAAWRGLPAQQTVVQPGRGPWLGDMLRGYARLAAVGRFRLYVVVVSMTSGCFMVFMAGAPIVLASYGIGPQGVGWYIMCVPLSYIVGNYITSRVVARQGERRMMRFGQLGTASGLLLLVALGLAGLKTPLAFALPLMLLGIGHGLLMPPALAGTVGVIPVLAGTAAALAGVSQQLTGAVGGYLVGLMHHDGAVNLGLLMLAYMACSACAQVVLHRR